MNGLLMKYEYMACATVIILLTKMEIWEQWQFMMTRWHAFGITTHLWAESYAE